MVVAPQGWVVVRVRANGWSLHPKKVVDEFGNPIVVERSMGSKPACTYTATLAKLGPVPLII